MTSRKKQIRLCRKISVPQPQVASRVVANIPQPPPQEYRCPQGTQQYGSAGQYGAPSTPLQEITDHIDVHKEHNNMDQLVNMEHHQLHYKKLLINLPILRNVKSDVVMQLDVLHLYSMMFLISVFY
eukprot:CAMPEP_0201596822 /NCGR_PEP_ID=MMETSP0190_2-20130828/193417_1 /ASSEMBLY_ACC=CAM_ASM_000263 /TAXON_ID=37353 /ORGANISM="Rosalina sp." /LENGTH=125 /DNA_ID=CAMNT_0048057389 /DNA_START=543 /DNA_END=920 /DNA_ORIENTATION=-